MKAQSLLIQFVLFFIVGFFLFLTIGNFFRIQSERFRENIGDLSLKLASTNIASYAINSMYACKQCDYVRNQIFFERSVAGYFIVANISQSGLAVFTTPGAKSYYSSMHNLNESIKNFGETSITKPIGLTLNRTKNLFIFEETLGGYIETTVTSTTVTTTTAVSTTSTTAPTTTSTTTGSSTTSSSTTTTTAPISTTSSTTTVPTTSTTSSTSSSSTTTTIEPWLAGWSYRKLHEIVGTTAGAQTNYQMSVTVYNTTGTDSGSIVYVGANARSDFGDIRFTANDKITLLDYWIEEAGTSYAKFWVEIQNIPASPSTEIIYVYYGNPGVTTTSNGRYTFDLFDDWESGTVDTGYWTTGGSVSPYWKTYTSTKYRGSYSSGNTLISHNQAVWIKKTISLPTTGRLEFYWRVSSEPLWDCLYYCVNNDACALFGGYVSKICGSVSWTGVTKDLASGSNSIKFAYGKDTGTSGGSDTGWIDNVKVRKYVSPEPTHGSWGAQQP